MITPNTRCPSPHPFLTSLTRIASTVIPFSFHRVILARTVFALHVLSAGGHRGRQKHGTERGRQRHGMRALQTDFGLSPKQNIPILACISPHSRVSILERRVTVRGRGVHALPRAAARKRQPNHRLSKKGRKWPRRPFPSASSCQKHPFVAHTQHLVRRLALRRQPRTPIPHKLVSCTPLH